MTADDVTLTDAVERVGRFLDERARPTPFAPDGFLPVDFLAEITRTGDRLLVSDLRCILDRLAAVQAEAEKWQAGCEVEHALNRRLIARAESAERRLAGAAREIP